MLVSMGAAGARAVQVTRAAALRPRPRGLKTRKRIAQDIVPVTMGPQGVVIDARPSLPEAATAAAGINDGAAAGADEALIALAVRHVVGRSVGMGIG